MRRNLCDFPDANCVADGQCPVEASDKNRLTARDG